MDGQIRVLDCTLRDGGHIVNGKFGEDVIRYTIQKLIDARTDIIEVGFLWETYLGPDYARYYSIDDVKKVLPKERGGSHFSLMADYIDLSHLDECDGTIEYIRLSFKRSRLKWALDTLDILNKKGYKVFINPVNCNVYSDEEYISVIKQANKHGAYGFSIVDTFGVLRNNDLAAKYYLVENNLDKDRVIGVHLHENLGLAYSLAQHLLDIKAPLRKITIDGSLYGMGRVPGNLCIEKIMDHCNVMYGTNYNLAATYDAIDDYIMPINKSVPWGYMVPYAISAQNNLHRTYAEYLIGKWKLKTSDINTILSQVSHEEAELFNENYIEDLYRAYLDVPVSDEGIIRLSSKLLGKKILLIAPGASVKENQYEIERHSMEDNVVSISINFIPDFMQTHMAFFSTIKRYETEIIKLDARSTEVIISSNLLRHVNESDYVISYKDITHHEGEYSEDSVLMMIALMKRIGVDNIIIAGFDGYSVNKSNYVNDSLERNSNGREIIGSQVHRILKSSYKDMDINFLTPSMYE